MNLLDLYKNCILCPRKCNIDRFTKKGFCGMSSDLEISSYMLHFGEEPCISHQNGSGTIFFSGCSLKCPFCQNKQISHYKTNGKIYSVDGLINIIDDLINQNADNINFVTPDHFLPHIACAIDHFKKKKTNIPFIYNCSGYQSLDNLKIAIDYLDIFLIDYKFSDINSAEYCIDNKLYPDTAEKALDFLFKNTGNLTLDKNGKAIKGVLVRHLIMPDFIDNSIKVINDLYFNYGNEIYLSLMSQYSPAYLNNDKSKINRKISKHEYNTVVNLVNRLGFKNGYIQDYINYDDQYLPDFDKKHVFDALKKNL